jgi:NTE family protein
VNLGLVLTGGGARAAYQVGALQALAELFGKATGCSKGKGGSAGAINGSSLTTGGRPRAVKLADTWLVDPGCTGRTP